MVYSFFRKMTENRQNMKVAIIGYGKMGREIEKILNQRGHEVGLIIDVDNAADRIKAIIRAEHARCRRSLNGYLQLLEETKDE